MIRFNQIEKQIKELCIACQNKDGSPSCKGYPLQECAAIYTIDQLTSGNQFVTKSAQKHCYWNRKILSEVISADFG